MPFKNIKDHQSESLIDSNTYDRVIPGFLINFRTLGRSFFLHIDDFLVYQSLADQGKKEYNGVSVNEKSITHQYCEVYGTELQGVLKKVKYRWYVGKLLDELIEIHGE